MGLIVEAFNVLAVEFADPYNPAGHGRIYPTIEESIEVLAASMASLAATVPGDRIDFFQCGDAELMNPHNFKRPEDLKTPALLPWSRGHRLYPFEHSKSAYMPVELVTAAVLAIGYTGPISLEVFNNSLDKPGADVPTVRAKRGMVGLQQLADLMRAIPAFWNTPARISKETMQVVIDGVRSRHTARL